MRRARIGGVAIGLVVGRAIVGRGGVVGHGDYLKRLAHRDGAGG